MFEPKEPSARISPATGWLRLASQTRISVARPRHDGRPASHGTLPAHMLQYKLVWAIGDQMSPIRIVRAVYWMVIAFNMRSTSMMM